MAGLRSPDWWSSPWPPGIQVMAFAAANLGGSVVAPTGGWDTGVVGWLTSKVVAATGVSVVALLVALVGIDALWGTWD